MAEHGDELPALAVLHLPHIEGLPSYIPSNTLFNPYNKAETSNPSTQETQRPTSVQFILIPVTSSPSISTEPSSSDEMSSTPPSTGPSNSQNPSLSELIRIYTMYCRLNMEGLLSLLSLNSKFHGHQQGQRSHYFLKYHLALHLPPL